MPRIKPVANASLNTGNASTSLAINGMSIAVDNGEPRTRNCGNSGIAKDCAYIVVNWASEFVFGANMLNYVRKIPVIAGWGLSIFFGIPAIAYLVSDFPKGIALLLISLIFMPALFRLTERFDWKVNTYGRLGAFVLALVLISSTAPKNDLNQAESLPSPTSTITPPAQKVETPSSPPIPTPEPSPVIESAEDRFIATLSSETDGLFASETVRVMAKHFYPIRKTLWVAMKDGDSVTSTAAMQVALTNFADQHGMEWDKERIEKMSRGIVRGFYKWNRENPGDLE